MSTASESWPWRWCRIYSLPFYYRTTNGIEPGLPEHLHQPNTIPPSSKTPAPSPPRPSFHSLRPERQRHAAEHHSSSSVSSSSTLLWLCTPAWGLLMLVLEPTKRPFLAVNSAWCQPLLHILAHERSLTSPSTCFIEIKICSRSQSGLTLITLLLGPL